MIRFETILLLLIVLLSAISESADASHPFHVTRAEIDYNAKRKTFEVAICVWPEDLAKAVSKIEKRTVDVDAESEKSRDAMFKKYVAKSFRFTPSKLSEDEISKAADIRWIGSELKVKQGWLYFEVDASAAASRWTIENEMFFEFNDDQMNQIQVRNGKEWISKTLSAEVPSTGWTRE